MTYWQKTKRIAWIWLTGWGVAHRHFSSVMRGLMDAAWGLAGAMVSVALLVFCVIAPLLFWLAPLIAAVVHKLEVREEVRRKKEREEAIRSMTSLAQTEDRQ